MGRSTLTHVNEFRYLGRYLGAKAVSVQRVRPVLGRCFLGRRFGAGVAIRTHHRKLGQRVLYAGCRNNDLPYQPSVQMSFGNSEVV
jgi:hypothetical protein